MRAVLPLPVWRLILDEPLRDRFEALSPKWQLSELKFHQVRDNRTGLLSWAFGIPGSSDSHYLRA